MTTPEPVVERVLEIALEHPAWGCNRVSDWLKLQGVSISPPTVQKLWNERSLGSRFERWLALEQQVAERPLALTAEQVQFLEKRNPQWKERHVESRRPGELLCQDTFFVGTLKGVGKVYLQAVVDTFSSYAFGLLATSKQPETAALLLHNEVLPFYRERQIEISALLTDNGREWFHLAAQARHCGTEAHPYELYLALNDLEHRRTQVRRPQANGFVERFNRTVLDEFFREAFRETFYESVEALQQDLDRWLVSYNTERPHQGYHNQDRRPMETIELYLKSVPEAA